MNQKKLEAFRIYYNHTIHPELLRMERQRKRLMWMVALAIIMFSGIVAISLYLQLMLLTLIAFLPFGFYLSYLAYQFRKFRLRFKPAIVNLIIDFMDDDVNYGTMHYDPKKKISKEEFLASRIFHTKAAIYEGEDWISGEMGDVPFEMSEILVKDLSTIRSKWDITFRGVFVRAAFHQGIRGEVLALPRNRKQYMTKSIRAFNYTGGELVSENELDQNFTKGFVVFASPEVHLDKVLPKSLQWTFMDFQQRSGKAIYFSILGNQFNLAITHEKDLLEPYWFQSNVSFDMVLTFFEDIQLITQLIAEFDKYN